MIRMRRIMRAPLTQAAGLQVEIERREERVRPSLHGGDGAEEGRPPQAWWEGDPLFQERDPFAMHDKVRRIGGGLVYLA